MSPRSVRERFRRARREGRPALIPFVTGGDPDLATTARLVIGIDRLGADLIEIGVPFSDPVADGVAIQRSTARAIEAGADLRGVLGMVRRIRPRVRAGIILFSYFNPILRFGIRRFAAGSAAAGVDAALAVDLPPEEAGEYRRELAAVGVETAFLVAPTTAADRVQSIAAAATGFLYYVSRTGVTGARDDLDPELRVRLGGIRRRVRLPVVVGFGISRPGQFAALSGLADGIVVGSAVVERIAAGGPADAILARLGRFLRGLRAGAAAGGRRRGRAGKEEE